MFRKLPENAPVHRPATSSTPTTASPPPSKKQKTIHFPTPSRPRPPRQTQLTSFISTPPSTPSKRTPGPAPKSSGKRPKNASILKFFKPVAPGERNRAREDGTSDALFIAHGGYGLDVSDPEDEEDYEDEQLERVLWAGDEVEEGRVGVLELGVAMQVAMLRSSPPPPPSPQTTQDTVEATSSPVAKLPLREKMEAVESSAPPKMVPKFDPAALKLNFSSSMLFGKPAALPVAKKEGKDAALMPGVEKEDTCDADCKPPGLLVKTETISGDCNSPSRLLKQETASEVDSVSISDSMEEPETRQAKSYKDDTNDSINRVLPWKLGSANELIDEIEDPTQQTQRRLLCESREDEIQSTLLNNHVEHKYDYDGIEDFEDFDGMGFEAREEAFGFDPAMRGVEGGFDEDWASDLKIVMKPPDDEIEWEPTCPICAAKLGTLSEADANKHVNQCLDGKPIPPAPKQEKTYTQPPTALTSNPHSPLKHASAPNRGVSAFSKLMTANTETHQWNSAVRAEAEAKGKKAAERTCPFYKILFKGPIAVDAFRYGKVPGVNAYFLSHFHSDHYVGLSAKWDHGPIYCSRATANLVRAKLRVDPKWVVELPWEEWVEIPQTGRVKVRGLDANHCPGSMLFLFEKPQGTGNRSLRVLHCGDFRAEKKHLNHPLLHNQPLDTTYLDTTYLDPKYAFPSQQSVITACADLCVSLSQSSAPPRSFSFLPAPPPPRLLVVVGTYSIGKERIATGIANALSSKIYAPASKMSTLQHLEDPALSRLLTPAPAAAQVHLTPLNSISPDALASYLASHPSFGRIVAFRPSGWSYKPPVPRPAAPKIEDVLYSPIWRSEYSVKEMRAQRGSGEKMAVYAVPYSEHSSFRELAVFCTALDVGRVVPTVNVGSAKARERMKAWIEKWEGVRRKGGFKGEDYGI